MNGWEGWMIGVEGYLAWVSLTLEGGCNGVIITFNNTSNLNYDKFNIGISFLIVSIRMLWCYKMD